MSSLGSFDQHPLSKFLSERRSTSSQNASLTGMGDFKCKCIISDEEYPKFMDLLNDYLFVQKKRPMNFVEQPRADSPKPLLIDLDFHYPNDKSIERTFTTENIKTFVADITIALDHFFNLENYETLRFFITLRNQPYQDVKGKKIKDGIHIMCPDITLLAEKQKVIRNWMLKEKSVGKAFRNTGYENLDKEVYDECMVRKQGWFFYGESKPNIPAYHLTNVFEYNPDTKELDDGDVSYSPRELIEMLSVRYNISPDDNDVRESVLPEFLSLAEKKPTQPQTPTADTQPQNQFVTQNLLATVAQLLPNMTNTNDREWKLYKDLVDCLSQTRAEGYEDWKRVGWCLHNISPDESMFDMWMDFSKKSSKYSSNNISSLRHEWDTMRGDGDGRTLTERSLHKWAREDNPVKYKEIIDNDLHEYIRQEVDKTHYHLAKLMQKMFGNDYVASVNMKSTDWFAFDRKIHSWRQMNQGICLRSLMVTHVAREIDRAADKIRVLFSSAKDQDSRNMYEKKIKDLHGVVGSLYSSGFKDSVMKECMMMFSQENFTSQLNMNPFLFGCANGIIELRAPIAGTSSTTNSHNTRVIFRDGKPEDMTSFLAGNNPPDNDPIYYKPYDPADPNIAEIMDFFEKIFPRADLRKYVLRLLSSCLEGKNREQQYYTFSGVGGNGKSKLVELMRLTIGDYQSSMQSTVLTRPRPSSGAANPELMAIRNKRFIYMAEPDEKEPINTSCMKQFSGEDVIEARGLFQDQEKFKVSGKLFMLCNKLPPIHSMDRGTWRRVRLCPFESLFVDPDSPDLISGKPNVFVRDNSIDDKLIKWRESFLSLLVYIYATEYAPFGLGQEPEIVIRESSRYKEAFDSFAKFRHQRVRRAMGREMKLRELQLIYKEWFKDHAGDTGQRIKDQEIANRLSEEFRNDFDGSVIKNYIAFKRDDEVEEFDQEESLMNSSS